MSSEPSPKSSSVLLPSKSGWVPDFGHPDLNWMGHDVAELGFGPGVDEWPRWTTVGFTSGLRLASVESSEAKTLLREWDHGSNLRPLADILFERLQRLRLGSVNYLQHLRTVLGKLLADPPKGWRTQLAGVSGIQQMVWWYRHSVVWGLQAGLDRDSLFTGGLLVLFDQLSLSQRFIGDRLVHILRSGAGRSRRAVLIEFFDYAYPATPIERASIVKAADHVLAELTCTNRTHETADWILCGFREGFVLSTRDTSLRRRLFAESTREGMQTVWSLFAKHIGPDPAGWHPERIVGESMGWLRKSHPTIIKPDCLATEFERIRHLFDFAFWMGLAAGANGNSTS